jgi:hypothetical protein
VPDELVQQALDESTEVLRRVLVRLHDHRQPDACEEDFAARNEGDVTALTKDRPKRFEATGEDVPAHHQLVSVSVKRGKRERGEKERKTHIANSLRRFFSSMKRVRHVENPANQ